MRTKICLFARGRRQSTATVIMQKLALTTSLMARFTEDIRFRKSRVIVRLSEHQDFMTSLEQFEKWLKRAKKNFDNQKQISPNANEIESQMLKAEVYLSIVINSSLLHANIAA